MTTTNDHKHTTLCFDICLPMLVRIITFISRRNEDKELTKIHRWFGVIYVDVIKEHEEDDLFAH